MQKSQTKSVLHTPFNNSQNNLNYLFDQAQTTPQPNTITNVEMEESPVSNFTTSISTSSNVADKSIFGKTD